ncbi:MAG: tetratricopeptide repeat protein [Deferribacteres bacterium]|nr:tetratricopeptide repeat protein [Deferribacteres bacterium]
MQKNNLLVIVFYFTAMTIFTSCAYYNTFYNTEKYFNGAIEKMEAEEEAEKISSSVTTEFDKTIKQASKVLQFYPDSKYIDDALMIIGQSFYYMEDYHKAERKFEELMENFPESEFVPATKLWLAKTHLKLNQYDQTEIELRLLIEKEKRKDIRTEARFWLAESYFSQEKFDKAAESYKEAANDLKDRKLKVTAYWQLGEINKEQQNFIAAADYFQAASKITKDQDKQFNALLEYGKAYSHGKDYQKATRIFLNLIDKFYTYKEVGLAKLELGRTLEMDGKQNEALDWYNEIIEDHPRTEASLGAYLQLGLYEETIRSDYDKAEEYYTKAKSQSSKGEAVEIVAQREKDIKQLITLEKQIAQLNEQIKSVEERAAQGDSSAVAVDDSTTAEETASQEDESDKAANREKPATRRDKTTGKKQKILTVADLDSLNSELMKEKLALAEHFLLQYNKPDSAVVQYLDILSGESKDEQRALSFYGLAYIFDNYKEKPLMRDSLYNILATNYTSTMQGRAAAKHLGMHVIDEKEASEEEQRIEAVENKLFQHNFAEKNRAELEKLINEFPETELQPKARYFLGWTYEQHLEKPEKAYEIYKELIEKYPQSDYAKDVKRRVKGIEDKRAEDEKAKAEKEAAEKAALNPPAEDADATKPVLKKDEDGKPQDELVPPPPNRRTNTKPAEKPTLERDQ